MPFNATAMASVAALAGAGALALGIRAATRSLQRELDTRYRRTEAWLAIYGVVRPRIPFPPIQPWQATPELLRWLVQLMLENKPALIVELGSGLSTVLAAYCVELAGTGRIVSVDHEARFCEATRDLLSRHGLAQHVRLIHAPLVPVEFAGGHSRWYDPGLLRAALDTEGRPIDLLVIDGPPGKDQALARLPAFPLLVDRLAPRAVVLIDDARRRDEQVMVARWMAQDPSLTREDLLTEKGTCILRRHR